MANKKNLAAGIVANNPGTSGTSLVLETGYGQTMPPVPFYLTLTPAGQLSTMGNSEIVEVTALATDTLTIVRARKDTTAKSIAAGWVAVNGIYTDDIGGASSIISSEDMVGTINGTNGTFTTVYSFYSINVYKNGVHMRPGSGNDYTVTGPNQITFNSGAIPLIGSSITASYITTDGVGAPTPSIYTAPVGMITQFGGTTAPGGYLLCDGTLYGTADYPALYAVIGNNFGAIPGAFAVPNLQQRFPLGKAISGTGSTLGETGGSIDHTHGLTTAAADIEITSNQINIRRVSGSFAATIRTPAGGNASATPSTAAYKTNLSGNTDPTNPPYQVVNYIIKAV